MHSYGIRLEKTRIIWIWDEEDMNGQNLHLTGIYIER
jgi:hypothetical protein